MVDAGKNSVKVALAGQVVATILKHPTPLNASILQPCEHGRQWIARMGLSGQATLAGVSACKTGTYVLSFEHLLADSEPTTDKFAGVYSTIFYVSTPADQIRVDVQPEGEWCACLL